MLTRVRDMNKNQVNCKHRIRLNLFESQLHTYLRIWISAGRTLALSLFGTFLPTLISSFVASM